MPAHLLINSLFKTIEYQLEDSDTLKVTELSISGAKSNTLSLSNLYIDEGQTTPSFVSWLVLTIGCAFIASVIYYSQFSALLSNNLMNSIFFLGSITCILAFFSKPMKTQVYRHSLSNKVALKLKSGSGSNVATVRFIKDLNSAIENAKKIELNKINLKKNIELQYDVQHKNVDELFNLGFIDEALYNRVCKSMHEKVFGKTTETGLGNNVIYLNR